MKKLHVSQENKVLLGICGGLSESFGINANLVRLIFVASLFAGTAGFWVYLALAVIMPKDSGEQQIIEVEVKEEGEGRKKIYRLWENRMLGGVCIGIARYFGWDVTLVRLAFVVATMFGGVGILLYLLFWFVFPSEE